MWLPWNIRMMTLHFRENMSKKLRGLVPGGACKSSRSVAVSSALRFCRGGLPGYGANRSVRVDLTGDRTGDRLVLTSEDGKTEAVVTAGETAQLQGDCGAGLCLRKVTRRSPTLGAHPPRCSVVLFDGTDTRAFDNGRMNDKGWLQAGTEIIPRYRNFQMHLEFLLPYMPDQVSQKRGNSGVYIHSRYEVQILDSFGTRGEFNECGSLYRQRPPDLNMCLPPRIWQTYDITFRAPTFDRCGKQVLSCPHFSTAQRSARP